MAAGSFIFHSAPSCSWGRSFPTRSVSQSDGQFGHLGDVSASFRVFPAEVKTETFRGKKIQLDKNTVLFIFVNIKAPQTSDLDLLLEDTCLSAKHCWNTRAEWTHVLGHYPAANSHKDSSLWNVLEGEELPSILGTLGALFLSLQKSHFIWAPQQQRVGEPCQMQNRNEQCL